MLFTTTARHSPAVYPSSTPLVSLRARPTPLAAQVEPDAATGLRRVSMQPYRRTSLGAGPHLAASPSVGQPTPLRTFSSAQTPGGAPAARGQRWSMEGHRRSLEGRRSAEAPQSPTAGGQGKLGV